MAAKQLILPANRAFNSNGLAVPGATASLYATGTLTPASFYSDSALTTSLGSTITANGAGRFDPMPYQNEDTAFRLIVKDADGVELDDIDPFYFGSALGGLITSATGTTVSTRVLLAAVSAPTANQSAFLTEAGREGMFAFDDSDLSSEVSTDTLQGVYVPPSSDTTGASGAWVRKISGFVRPEWFGAAGDGSTDDTAEIEACCAVADITGSEVFLKSGVTYIISSEVTVPSGVNILGTRDSVLKLQTQVTTTTTAAISAGTGSKSFTVNSTTGFAVGQSVMIFNGSTVSPNDSYSHAGRQISAINATTKTITIAAGPTVSAHASGATIATTAHLLLCQGNNVLEGFTIDGNEANNTYGHWITTALVVQEGDNVTLRDIHFKDTPSDAVLVGGPSGDYISGSWVEDCIFTNIGGNGVHYGNAQDLFVRGCRFIDGNQRYADPVEQAGGASARSGHQDGAISLSDYVRRLLVSGNIVDDWICGVGAVGTSGANYNDEITVTGNEFIDCYSPLEVTYDSARIVFSGNRCKASFPFLSGGQRWDRHFLNFNISGASLRPRNIVISGNFFKNLVIYGERLKDATITGNHWDNRDMNGASYTSLDIHGCISLYSPNSVSIAGNTFLGGYSGVYLQNSHGAAFCRDVTVSDNLFVDQYIAALSGDASVGPVTARVSNNVVRADSAGVKEDGAATSISASWSGIGVVEGLRVAGNTIDHNVGSAWTAAHTATSLARENNVVNGLQEVPPEYADDVAAGAASVPVGGVYRTGSAIKRRVA